MYKINKKGGVIFVRQTNCVLSEFYCTQCGTKAIPVWRRKGREREAGHLKRLFCLTCNKECNCVEVKPFSKYNYENFCEEYEYGNFTENGERKFTYGKLKEMINNGKIEKVKTVADGRSTRQWQEHLDQES